MQWLEDLPHWLMTWLEDLRCLGKSVNKKYQETHQKIR